MFLASHHRWSFRAGSITVLFAFVLQTFAPVNLSAQSIPISSNAYGLELTADGLLMPVGLSVDPQNPLQFEMLVDQGELSLRGAKGAEAISDRDRHASLAMTEKEGMKLIKYFLASLTISEKDMWVNLSPAEPDRIVPPVFAQTAMGRDMLAQDSVLKQLTSSLMNPESESGKAFWEKIYAAAQSRNIPVETLNKVWIIPAKAVVYQNGFHAYVVEAKLKVMLEEDYDQTVGATPRGRPESGRHGGLPLQDDIKSIIRQTILPIIEDEVNNGESFANLRQMYRAMILAYWFKQSLKQSLLGQVYVDRKKVSGIEMSRHSEERSDEESQSGILRQKTPQDDVDERTIDVIYQQYLTKFRDGAFDLIKEDYDPQTQTTVVRKYFSGGMFGAGDLGQKLALTTNGALVPNRAALTAINFRVDKTNSAMLQIDSERVALEILLYSRSDQYGKDTLGKINDEAQWKSTLQQRLKELFENQTAFEVDIPWSLQDKQYTSKVAVSLNENNFLKVAVDNPDLQPRIFMVNLERFQIAAEVTDSASQAMPAEVQGVSFYPEKDFPQGAPLTDKQITAIRARAQRTPQEVIDLLKRAQEQEILLEIIDHLRGADLGGSALDLPEFQDILTELGITSFDDLPSTIAIASEFATKIRFELADDEDAIEYVAPDYGIEKKVFENDLQLVKTKNGKWILPEGQKDAPGYIFRNIFGLRGITIILDEIPPMALAGGMESSNVFNTALIAAASILSGVNLSPAEIFNLAVKLENDEFGGLTGGQGHLSTLTGGIYQQVWTSGIKDSKGNIVNHYSAVAVPLDKDGTISEQVEKHMMLVQAGKVYKDGEAITRRTAASVNFIWTYLLRDRDTVGFPLHKEKIGLTRAIKNALLEGDFETIARCMIRYAEIRDQLIERWLNLMMDAKENKPGTPEYAQEYVKAVFDKTHEHYGEYQVLRDAFEDGGSEAVRNTRLYSLGPIGELMDAAKTEGIAIFPLGAGGPGANLIAVGPKGSEHLRDFLEQRGLRPFDENEAHETIRGTGTSKGYMQFKVGQEPMRFEGFEELGLQTPKLPEIRTITAQDVNMVSNAMLTRLDVKAFRKLFPGFTEVHNGPNRVSFTTSDYLYDIKFDGWNGATSNPDNVTITIKPHILPAKQENPGVNVPEFGEATFNALKRFSQYKVSKSSSENGEFVITMARSEERKSNSAMTSTDIAEEVEKEQGFELTIRLSEQFLRLAFLQEKHLDAYEKTKDLIQAIPQDTKKRVETYLPFVEGIVNNGYWKAEWYSEYESWDRGISKQQFGYLPLHMQVVIASTFKALDSIGVFEFITRNETTYYRDLVQYVKEKTGITRYKSHQYLRGVLKALASWDWLDRDNRQSKNHMKFKVTERGKDMIKWVPLYVEVSAGLGESIKWMDHLFRAPSENGLPSGYVPSFDNYIKRAKQNWVLEGQVPPEAVIENLNGFFVAPILMGFSQMGYFDHIQADLSINIEDLPGKSKNIPNLIAAFQFLSLSGYGTLNGAKFTFTPKGLYAVRRNLSFGVPRSYDPSYALAEKFLFSDPKKIPRMAEINGVLRELLVNRPLNVIGSGEAHKTYFKKAEPMVLERVNEKVLKLPKPNELREDRPYVFRVGDIGCGNGKWLKLIYQAIIEKSEYGKLMKAHPRLYKLEMVGIDFFEESRIETEKTLSKAKIPHRVIHGDIGRPGKELTQELEKAGIQEKLDLIVHSVLVHNRPWYGVHDHEAAKKLKALSFSDWGWRGVWIPNNFIEQNLFELFGDFRKVTESMVIIELHTIDEKIAAKNVNKVFDLAYWLSHLYSDQFIVEYEVFRARAEQAGWKFAGEPYLPAGDPKVATISISSLVADPAMAAKSDNSQLGGIDFDPTAMTFETQGNAAMMAPTQEQLQEFIDAPGFTPFIINIMPVVSPRLWLGLNDEESQPKQMADALWKDSLSYAVKPEEEIHM